MSNIMPYYASSRLKIERAKKHIADLNPIIDALTERYTITVERDFETLQHSVKCEHPTLDALRQELAIIVGDAIHNLHSALDHAWIETLQRLAPTVLSNHPNSNFPVRKSSTDLEGVLKRQEIHIACPKLYKRIVSDIKPHAGGNEEVVSLHALDIADKHKLLIPVVNATSILGLTVENKNGDLISGFTLATGDNPFFVDLPFDCEVKEKGKVTIEVVFEHKSFVESLPVHGALLHLSAVVPKIVELLENL